MIVVRIHICSVIEWTRMAPKSRDEPSNDGLLNRGYKYIYIYIYISDMGYPEPMVAI